MKYTVNKMRLEQGKANFDDAWKLVQLCKRYGFVKEEYLEAKIIAVRILVQNNLYEDALVKIE